MYRLELEKGKVHFGKVRKNGVDIQDSMSFRRCVSIDVSCRSGGALISYYHQLNTLYRVKNEEKKKLATEA